jgi:peptidoglycan/LPS O-acetylase OafA/YrhL
VDHSRVDYLDGWRGLAITLVLCAHFLPFPLGLNAGRLGVDIFFCLSGFLMSNILYVKRTPLTVFYKRRISRILPVFLLFVAMTYTVDWFMRGPRSWVEVISTATFLRTYIPATPTIWQVDLPIGHLWSLNVEEHSYIFLSIVAAVALARGRESFVLIAAGLLTMVIHLAYIKFPAIAPSSGDLGTEVTASHLMISAGYFLIRGHFRRFVQPWMPIAALMLAAFCYTRFAPWWSPLLASPFLLAFAVNHLSEAAEGFHRVLAFAPLRYLGLWSYSIYIWQHPFYKYQDLLAPGAAFAGAMVLSLLSFYCFEAPVRSWLNKRW